MPRHQKVRANQWCKFKRTFSNQTSETRYVREIIFGKRSNRTYWEITTEPETLPDNSTSFVMTNLQGKTGQIKKILGNLYGLRTWVEYGFRQCKQELGWTDYRFTKFSDIEKWWELIFSAYLMISLNSKAFALEKPTQTPLDSCPTLPSFPLHQQWNSQGGWKTTLNNLRLLIQPIMLFWLIFPRERCFSKSLFIAGLSSAYCSHESISLLLSRWLSWVFNYFLNPESDKRGVVYKRNIKKAKLKRVGD